MSATRSVEATVEANLVIGRIRSTCGRSWSPPHAVLGLRGLAADVQHRTLRTERGGDAGDRVGAARAGGGHHASESPGLARVAVRRVRRDLLVAHVHHVDALVEAAVVDVDDVAPQRVKMVSTPSFLSALATR